MGPQEPLVATVKKWKLAWFGHVTYQDSLSKDILQSTLKGGWCRGWQRKCWMDKTNEWTCLPMPDGLLQRRLEESLGWIIYHVLLMTQVVKRLDWTELLMSYNFEQRFCCLFVWENSFGSAEKKVSHKPKTNLIFILALSYNIKRQTWDSVHSKIRWYCTHEDYTGTDESALQ